MGYFEDATTSLLVQTPQLNTAENISMPIKGTYGRTWQTLRLPGDLMTREYFEILNKEYIKLVAKLVSIKYLGQETEDLVNHVTATMQKILSDTPSDLDINIIKPEIYSQILEVTLQVEDAVVRLVAPNAPRLDLNNPENLFQTIENDIIPHGN